MSALSQGRNDNRQELSGKPPSFRGNQPSPCSIHGHRKMDFICTSWVTGDGRAVSGASFPKPRLHEGLEYLERENSKSMCWLGLRVILKRRDMLKSNFAEISFLLGAGLFDTRLEVSSVHKLLNEVHKLFSPS